MVIWTTKHALTWPTVITKRVQETQNLEWLREEYMLLHDRAPRNMNAWQIYWTRPAWNEMLWWYYKRTFWKCTTWHKLDPKNVLHDQTSKHDLHWLGNYMTFSRNTAVRISTQNASTLSNHVLHHQPTNTEQCTTEKHHETNHAKRLSAWQHMWTQCHRQKSEIWKTTSINLMQGCIDCKQPKA